ncbi:MAG: prolipoprotein diacylglyceryl transferase [Clostridia bacterium]|nr:prolipoprotein diacylglyceryl transferase [Clostridia bacterium]
MNSNISEISFPGLGIGPFEINNTAFTLFGHQIRWYAIIICIGIISAVFYVVFRAKQKNIKADTVMDIGIVTIPLAIIGARIYYVIFYGVSSFGEIFAIWKGGLAIYGAIIVGAVCVIVMCRVKKLSFFAFADMTAPSVMLGQAIGRWGNFMNGEAYGAETDIFCRMGLCNWRTGYKYVEVHPTFLYESLWNFIGFALINIFYHKRKFHGEVLFWYVGWYGLGRTFIELLRQDSLYMGSIRVSSLLGLICFLVCAPLIVILRVKHAKKVKAGEIEKDDLCHIAYLLGIDKVKKTEKSREKQKTEDELEEELDKAAAKDAAEDEKTEDANGSAD